MLTFVNSMVSTYQSILEFTQTAVTQDWLSGFA